MNILKIPSMNKTTAVMGQFSDFWSAQWATKVMTPASMYFLWKQGS